MTRLLIALLLLPALAWSAPVNFQREIALCGDGTGNRKAQFTDGVCTPPNVYFTGDFEGATAGARIQTQTSTSNGYAVATLKNPDVTCTRIYSSTGAGNVDTGAATDAHVMASGGTVGADTVTARKGGYFFYMSLDYAKEYGIMNEDSACTDANLDKPRAQVQVEDSAHGLAFDQEVWAGWSFYLPTNWQHEQAKSSNVRGLEVLSLNINAHQSDLEFQIYRRNDGRAYDSWTMVLYTDPLDTNEHSDTVGCSPFPSATCRRSLLDANGGSTTVDDGDIGHWTDFVIRFRLNPFSVQTNANTCANSGKNQVYQGNQGILQLWKSTGTAGSSALTVTAITKANPGVVTYTGTDPSNGDIFYLTGVSGMTEANAKYVRVSGVNAGADTFNWTDSIAANVNTSAYSTYTSGGTLTPSRGMKRVLNYVSTPIGLCPASSGLIQVRPRSYKYNWKKQLPPTWTNPIIMGFDELRFGKTATHGTGFADVHPDGYAAP